MKCRITRRSLLKASSIIAFPMVLPSSVFGATAPSNRVHIAQIGCGARGTDVMKGFASDPTGRYVATCDPFAARRQAAAEYLKTLYDDSGVSTTADFREILARPDVDAVVICSSDHWHVPLAIAAAQAGKDIYVEKPLSPAMSWSQRLRKVVATHGRVVQYGTQQRSSSTFRHVCELIRNCYLGRIRSVDVWCIDGTRAKDWMTSASTIVEPVPPGLDYEIWQGPAPSRPYNHYRVHREGSFHTYDYSIGFLSGWGAHPLDIAQWGLDRDTTGPVEVRGTGKIPTEGLYTTVYDWNIQCRYADDVTLRFLSWPLATGTIMAYRRRVSDHGTTFFGEEGWISIDRGGIEASDPRLLSLKLKPGDQRLPVSRYHDRNFLDSVRTRRQPISNLETAIRCDTISHLSDIAVRTGRTIHWDPATETIIGDETASRYLHRPMRAPFQF